MPDPLRLVIFDVDGTLIDSQAFILAAMRGAFAEAGLPVPADAAILGIVGLSLPEAITRLHPVGSEPEIFDMVELYKGNFIRIRKELGGEAVAPLYPGTRAALEALAEAGVLMAIATGKARRGLDHALDAHRLRHFFSASQTADDAPSKPAPGMVLNCLSATGVEARNAVMLGDTSFDALMARAAGVPALGVAWGYHAPEELHAAGVTEVLDHFDALPEALGRLWRAA